MLSKLRFSLTMNTTCLMGVVVGNFVASTTEGRGAGVVVGPDVGAVGAGGGAGPSLVQAAATSANAAQMARGRIARRVGRLIVVVGRGSVPGMGRKGLSPGRPSSIIRAHAPVPRFPRRGRGRPRGSDRLARRRHHGRADGPAARFNGAGDHRG